MDSPALVPAILHQATKEPTSLFYLGRFEKVPNLLGFINGELASLEDRAPLMNSLFVDLQLGKLSPDMKNLVLSFYDDGSDQQKRVIQILNSLQMFYELDRKVGDLPSPLETYHRVLLHSSHREMKPIGSVLSLLGRGNFFGQTGAQPNYPGLFGLVSTGRSLSFLAMALSLVLPRSRSAQLFFPLTPPSLGNRAWSRI